jgi:hypothetical protein
MEHLKFALLALAAGMMLSGCVGQTSTGDMQSYRNTDQDIHAVFSNGNDYRTPIKPWFFGY